MKAPIRRSDLQRLNRYYQIKILLYIIFSLLSFPELPRPIHFSIIASLCMFGLLPLLPHQVISLPIAVGGGLSFALLFTK
jgi:hypothetical protein